MALPLRAKRADAGVMANQHPSRDDDLVKAREIVGEYGLLIGPAGEMSEIVAKAVADGIALGRKQGLAMAGEAMKELQAAIDERAEAAASSIDPLQKS